jgi:hypothetical protein
MRANNADNLTSSGSESASYELNEPHARRDGPALGSSIGSSEEQDPENEEGQEPEDDA